MVLTTGIAVGVGYNGKATNATETNSTTTGVFLSYLDARQRG